MKTHKEDVEVYCRSNFPFRRNSRSLMFFHTFHFLRKKDKPHFPALSRSSSYPSLNKFKEPACQIKKKTNIFKHRNYLIKSSTSNFSAWKFSLQRTKTDNALCHNEFPCEANNQAHIHMHTHPHTDTNLTSLSGRNISLMIYVFFTAQGLLYVTVVLCSAGWVPT